MNRDTRIETMRGLACLLLVAYHAVGDGARGLRLPDDAWLRWLSDSFVYLRMPLFTFLSGYVYAMRPPAQRQDAFAFFRGKTRRLLLPLFAVGLTYQLLQRSISGVNSEHQGSWFGFMLYAYDHFWYLQALFIIFAVIYLLDISGAGRDRRLLWLSTMCAFLALPHIRFANDLFSINGAFYLLPYFLLGVAVRRTPRLSIPTQLPHGSRLWSALALLVYIAWHQASLADWPVPALSADALSGQLYSVISISFLYSLGWQSSFLTRIGGYSYSIYLFHVFGTAGARILLKRLGLDEPFLLFTGCMLAGILLPIVIERLLDRWNWTRMFFLGRRWYRAPIRADKE